MTKQNGPKKGNILLIVIASVFVIIVGSWIVISYWIKSESAKIVRQEENRFNSLSNDDKARELGLELLSQDQANLLSKTAFQRLNQYRTLNKLKPFVVDEKICQSLKDALAKLTKWGDLTELSSINEVSIIKSSLSLYNSSHLFTVGGVSTKSEGAKQIDKWVAGMNDKTALLVNTAAGTHACAEASQNALLLMIMGNVEK